MPGTNAAFARVEIDAQLKDLGWDALKRAIAVIESLLARGFSSDQAVEHSLEDAAVV
jgi:uncharacterized protein YoaH (UPF0181 family)